MLRIERMAALEPLFVDVTWAAGGRSGDLTRTITANAKKVRKVIEFKERASCAPLVLMLVFFDVLGQFSGVESMMHLCLTGMTKDDLRRALLAAKADGIKNILALRGDPLAGKDTWEAVDGGLRHAGELVEYIREEFDGYFCVGVAGYPEGYIDSDDFARDIAHLKAKVDAGAEFVMTQFFYEVDVYFQFVKACREAEIEVPIVPGIMPIQGFATFEKMTTFFKTKVPEEIHAALLPIKDDDEAVKAYGIRLGMEMGQKVNLHADD